MAISQYFMIDLYIELNFFVDRDYEHYFQNIIKKKVSVKFQSIPAKMVKQSQKLVKMVSFFYQNITLFFSSSVPFYLVFGKKELTQIWQGMIEKKCFLEYFFHF